MNTKFFFLFIILLISTSSTEAQRLFKGHVYSDANNQMGGVEVIVGTSEKYHTLTDDEGNFSFEMSELGKTINLLLVSIGCNAIDTTVYVSGKSGVHQFKMNCNNVLDEVQIQASVPHKRKGATILSLEKINRQPVLLGDANVFKALQSQVGVNFGVEGSSDLVVRGGGVGENLIMLDDIPVYLSSHIFGFVSPFEAEIVDEVKFYKNGFPAKFGGKMSSVIDIKTRGFHTPQKIKKLKVGILSNTYYYSNIIKDKVYVSFSCRRTLIDAFSYLFNTFAQSEEKVIPSFYDTYLKVEIPIGNKSTLDISTMYGTDRVLLKNNSVDVEPSYEEKNLTKTRSPMIGLNHNYQSGRVQVQTTLARSYYRHSNITEMSSPTESYNYDIYNRLTIVKSNLSLQLNNNFHLNSGVDYQVKENTIRETYEEEDQNENFNVPLSGQDLNGYLSINIDSEKTSSSIGIHLLSLPNAQFITYIEPRVYLDYFHNGHKVHATYSQIHQTDHLIANQSLISYIKTWLPANSQYLPSRSIEYGMGYQWQHRKGILDVEMYLKQRSNLVHPKQGDPLVVNTSNIDNLLKNGSGITYGFEVSYIHTLSNNIDLEASYSYGKSMLTYPDLNGGKPFLDYFDRTHQIKCLYKHQLGTTWSFTGQFTYLSGTPFTYISHLFPQITIGDEPLQIYNPPAVYFFNELNNERLPAHHRVDINFSKEKTHQKYKSILTLGVYNAYARINPFAVEVKGDPYLSPSMENPYPPETFHYDIVSYFNFIPFINYTIEF